MLYDLASLVVSGHRETFTTVWAINRLCLPKFPPTLFIIIIILLIRTLTRRSSLLANV